MERDTLLEPFATAAGGYVISQDVATPAAGATAEFTAAGKYGLRLLAARLSLTTDATVANRLVTLDYIDGQGKTRLKNGASVLITASTSGQTFEWDAHRTIAEWNTGTPIFCPLAPLFLPPNWTVKFAVANIQAADAISGLSLWYERFDTGAVIS